MMRKIAVLCVLFVCTVFSLCALEHTGPKYDTVPRYAMDRLGEELAQENRLQLITSGLGSLVDAKDAPWALGFVMREPMTIEEARPLANRLAAKLVDLIHTDASFDHYLKSSEPGRELNGDMIVYRLAFWDQNTDRYLAPYLAEVVFKNNQLYYYYADPQTQALQEPLVEPLMR